MDHIRLSRLCDATTDIESSTESIHSDYALFDMAASERADQNRMSDAVSSALSRLNFDDASVALDDSKYAIGGPNDDATDLLSEPVPDADADLMTADISEPTVEALISALLSTDSHAIPRHSPDVRIRDRIRTGVDDAGNAAPASTSSRFSSYSIMLSCLHTTMQALSQEMNDVIEACAQQIDAYQAARVALYDACRNGLAPAEAGTQSQPLDASDTISNVLERQQKCRDTLVEKKNALKEAVRTASSMLSLTTVFPNERGDAKRSEPPQSPPKIKLRANRQVTLKRTFSHPIGRSIRQKSMPLGAEASVSMDDLPVRFYKPVSATRSVTVFRTPEDQVDLTRNADLHDVMERFRLTTSYPDLEKTEGWSGSDSGTSGSEKDT